MPDAAPPQTVSGTTTGDITHLHEARFRALAELEASLVSCWLPDSTLTFVNQAYACLFGTTPDALVGVPWRTLHPDAEQPALQDYLAEVAAHPAPRSHEQQLMTADGQVYWFYWTNTPIFDEDGALLEFQSVGIDITARKAAEDALQAQRLFLQEIFASIQDGLCVLDAELTVLATNPTIQRWFAECLPLEGRKCYQAFHGRETPCPDCLVLRALESAEAVSDLQILPDGDGALHCREITAFPLLDTEKRSVKGVIEYVRDVTERQQTEVALAQSEATLRALLNASADAAFLIDTQRTILAVNEALARRFGRTTTELLGTDAFSFLPSPVAELRKVQFQRVIDSGRPVRFEDQRDGRWYDNSFHPIRDAEGQVVRLAGFSRDITARKETEALIQLVALEQTVVAELGRQALMGEAVPELFRLALDHTGHLLDSDMCEVFALQPDRETLLLAAGIKWTADDIGQASIVLPRGVAETSLMVTLDSPQGQELIPSLFWDAGMMSHAFVAIHANQRLWGLLGIHKRTHHAFSQGEIHFLESVANILGAAITQNEQREQLTYVSTHDAITGLYNRQFFETELKRLARGRHFPVSVVMADLDGLKSVNDTHGHPAGDALLRRTGEMLTTVVRAEDIVARVGGDEFTVLLPDFALTSDDLQARIANYAAAHPVPDEAPHLILSFGIAVAVDGNGLLEAVSIADQRMYQMKRAAGRRRK